MCMLHLCALYVVSEVTVASKTATKVKFYLIFGIRVHVVCASKCPLEESEATVASKQEENNCELCHR